MTLMISIVWNNRSIPICWVVRQAPKGHFPEQMHVDLFTEFANIIKDCGLSQSEIVVLGDGEFDGDQLIKLCQSQDWSYVLKTAKDTLVSETKGLQDTSKMGHVRPPLGRNQFFLCLRCILNLLKIFKPMHWFGIIQNINVHYIYSVIWQMLGISPSRIRKDILLRLFLQI